jgi:Phage capsid protein
MADYPITYNVTEFSELALLDYQQMESLLVKAVRRVPSPNAKTYRWVRNSQVSANRGYQRYSPYALSVPTQVPVTVSPVAVYCTIPVEKWDQFQTNIDMQAENRKLAIAAVYRELDRLIIEAVQNHIVAVPGNLLTLPDANQLTVKSANYVATILAQNEAWVDGQMYMAVSPQAYGNLRDSNNYIANPNGANQAVVNTGKVGMVLGFNEPIKSNLLLNGASGSGQRRRFANDKDAIHLVETEPFNIEAERIPGTGYGVVTARLMANAIVAKPQGVWAFDITQS